MRIHIKPQSPFIRSTISISYRLFGIRDSDTVCRIVHSRAGLRTGPRAQARSHARFHVRVRACVRVRVCVCVCV
jgi:hypothetical protein